MDFRSFDGDLDKREKLLVEIGCLLQPLLQYYLL